jgi:hypothetical protein
MAQRPSRLLLGLPETRSLIFLIKNSPDQAEGYLDYLQPPCSCVEANAIRQQIEKWDSRNASKRAWSTISTNHNTKNSIPEL